MQCVVAIPHLQPWLRPGIISSRLRSVTGSGFAIGRTTSWNECVSNPRLGFLASGLLGTGELHSQLRKWMENHPTSCATARHQGPTIHASLMVDPAMWIVRTTAFYVLLQVGLAGRRGHRPSDSESEDLKDNGPLAWIQNLLRGDTDEKRNKAQSKVRSKWHASTKGTLVRRYRVPTKAGGRKLLSAISSLLADDDTFRDVATHKGCQIRRENAHAESVCCHNVRALFDELPTPHLVVEITVFPAGPITAAHYEKADKIEKVLRTGIAI